MELSYQLSKVLYVVGLILDFQYIFNYKWKYCNKVFRTVSIWITPDGTGFLSDNTGQLANVAAKNITNIYFSGFSKPRDLTLLLIANAPFRSDDMIYILAGEESQRCLKDAERNKSH